MIEVSFIPESVIKCEISSILPLKNLFLSPIFELDASTKTGPLQWFIIALLTNVSWNTDVLIPKSTDTPLTPIKHLSAITDEKIVVANSPTNDCFLSYTWPPVNIRSTFGPILENNALPY